MADPLQPLTKEERAQRVQHARGVLAGRHGARQGEAVEDVLRYEAAVASLEAENAQLRARLAKVETILRDLYDEDECSYDHHGYCQAHLWFASPAEDVTDLSDRGVCPHRRAQEYFKKADSGEPHPAPEPPTEHCEKSGPILCHFGKNHDGPCGRFIPPHRSGGCTDNMAPPPSTPATTEN